MDFTIYKKPKLVSFNKRMIPKGSHITVSEAGGRIYFSNDIVEKYKLLSFPPTFALTNKNEWAIIFTEQTEHSFSLMEYRGTYYFHFSDIVHRILGKYEKKKMWFSLEKTEIPFAFILKEYEPNPDDLACSRSTYSHKRSMLAKDTTVSNPSSFYESLLDPEKYKAKD